MASTAAAVPPVLERFSRRLPSTNHGLRIETAVRVLTRVSIIRSLWYSARFKGRFFVARRSKISIARSARVEFAPNGFLFVGFEHQTPTPALLHMGKGATLVVDGTVQFMRGTRVIIHDGGRLRIGDRVVFNDCSLLTCYLSVSFGDGGGLAFNANLMDTDLHPIGSGDSWSTPSLPVQVGDHALVGSNAIVLKGVSIGEDAIVAAGAVVVKDVPARTVVAGNPARVVKQDVTWV